MFEWIHYFLMQHPILSPLLYLVLHILCAVLIIPCSPMAVIAGALWGQWLGLGCSMLAAFLSSCVTFGLARYFLKAPLYRFFSRRYSKTDWFLDQTENHGWNFVAYVQLNPAAPRSTL
ncbi:MAG: VTT domain-containing protein, partial [Methylococcales bacterium]|nr:VTT domain-containing protein [Methylococcales bacterium]